jgi:hypothetical protein
MGLTSRDGVVDLDSVSWLCANGALHASSRPATPTSREKRTREDESLPETGATAEIMETKKQYAKIAGFDINPQGTIAYTADVDNGIQKYVKANGTWQFAYNFSIPQVIPEAVNHGDGCFAVAVDFSGASPIVYATTTEGYNGSVNSNRVVQIVDTGANAAVTTIAQSKSDEIAYRGIDFTPGSK